MMAWIGVTVAFLAGAAILVAAMVRRAGDVGNLGSVSPRWIAEHRMGARRQ
jgi:hypothetical protein